MCHFYFYLKDPQVLTIDDYRQLAVCLLSMPYFPESIPWRKHDGHVCNYKRTCIFQIFDFDCNATMLLSRSRVCFLCDSNRIARLTGPRDRRTDWRKYEQFFFLFSFLFRFPPFRERGAAREGEGESRAKSVRGRGAPISSYAV